MSKKFTGIRDPSVSNEIFLVHGKHEFRTNVELFLTQQGLKGIVLEDEPSEGKGLLEKFEECSGRARYAIVLLTPDDKGGLATKRTKYKPRARQNVIFELGFFLAKLKRKGVCAIYFEDVELPSNFYGMTYIPYDGSVSWKGKLATELQTAGFMIDRDKIT